MMTHQESSETRVPDGATNAEVSMWRRPAGTTDVTHDHAVRIARSLARNAQARDRLLPNGVLKRLWGLLETVPGAREAYGCPQHRELRQHGRNLTAAELEEAADRLEGRGYHT